MGKYWDELPWFAPHLSQTELGAFVLLARFYLDHGGLPLECNPDVGSNPIAFLALVESRCYVLCRSVTPDEKEAVRNVLVRYFPNYRNDRLEQELRVKKLITKMKKRAGSLGGKAQRKPRTSTCLTDARPKLAKVPPRNHAFGVTRMLVNYRDIDPKDDKECADYVFGVGLDLLMAQGTPEMAARKLLNHVVTQAGAPAAAKAINELTAGETTNPRGFLASVARKGREESHAQ